MSDPTVYDNLEKARQAVDEVARADSVRLAELRTELLGRKAGALTAVLRSLNEMPVAERRSVGTRANEVKRSLERAIADRERELTELATAVSQLDQSMPARAVWRGAIHPVTAVVDEICEVFKELGFTRVVGPEAETEDYNFTKLNIALDHPAADMQDTFYLTPGIVLRTHTSPMQARTLERFKPPVRILVPGRVYRRDAWDPSHAPVFEQIEGLVVDEGVNFVDFKAAIDFFVKRFFGAATKERFRPSFFPFTEPSAEVDARLVRTAATSRSWVLGWSIRPYWRTAASTRNATLATRSVWVRTVSRCTGMVYRTFGCSSTTICASWASLWNRHERFRQLAFCPAGSGDRSN
jgi:phenylalanyl-tRNA synthetase alpha chain